MKIRAVFTFFLAVALQGCVTPDSNRPDSAIDNPLLQTWQGPYGGVPAFDEMNTADIQPAFELAMAEHLTNIESIANAPDKPDFENTIVALERSSPMLDRLFSYYGIWRSNQSTPEFREIQQQMAPVISAHFSKINQNKALFARIDAVYRDSLEKPLAADQQRLVWLTRDGFARNGATLEGEAADRYAQINQRLAELHTQFANNVLADEEKYTLYIDQNQLSGLPDSFVSAAAEAATQDGREGEYAIKNTRSSMDPFLTFSDERDLRQRVWENYYSRGDNDDVNDNKAIIAEILQLRDERVGLLGYDNYASWRLENRMAKTPEAAQALMDAVWPAALARVREEVADMQAIADAAGEELTIEPWDYRYYAEKVRRARYDLDSDEVKQYLQLDQLREAMFFVAQRLFNMRFTELEGGTVPVFHEDVRVWEVRSTENDSLIGLWYLDPFARKGKRSGAWATSYRSHSTIDGETAVLSANNSNFIKPAKGEAVLVSWSDAETFFHEFGHALHSLSSKVRYPSLNGGVRDYTEFQSQLLERWLLTDEVINRYMRHYQTGEVIPEELVAKIKRAATFNQGFATTEYLASALMDMKYHTMDPAGIDVRAYEKQSLAALGMPREIPMRHRSPHFAHIFSGEGYSAGYYGYLWADVLTSDAAEAFAEAPGGFYDEALAERLVQYLFSVRNALDPAEAYRKFRGRDARIDALMRDRGFPVPAN